MKPLFCSKYTTGYAPLNGSETKIISITTSGGYGIHTLKGKKATFRFGQNEPSCDCVTNLKKEG
jgi:hypothetical protein